MNNSFFKKDGTLDINFLKNETNKLIKQRKLREENQKIYRLIDNLNYSLKEYTRFSYSKIESYILEIEDINLIYDNIERERECILDYLKQYNHINYDEIENENIVIIMNLVLEAMPSIKGIILFDAEKREFYHANDIKPSLITEISESKPRIEHTHMEHSGIKGFVKKLFVKLFG